MPVYKICNKNGCNIRISYKDTYCDKHKREVNNTYNNQIRNASEFDKKVAKFYASKEWRHIRNRKILEQPLCEICLENGIITKAKIVHHLIEVRDDYSKRLDYINLQCVCQECHNKIHKEGEKVNE